MESAMLENCVSDRFFRQSSSPNFRISLGVVGLALLLIPAAADAVDEQRISFRNHNPFLQIYGLPPFQTATRVTDGESNYNISLDIANHADSDTTSIESAVIDGESYFLNFSLRHGLTPWLEVGLDVPLVAHTNGMFDNLIEGWHEFLGISNNNRSGPSNQLHFSFDSSRAAAYELTSSTYGVGDIQLTAAVPLWEAHEPNRRVVTLRSGLKLPTGDAATLRGSGAIDVSLGLYASDTSMSAKHNLSVTGFGGVLFLGSGDVLPEIQKHTVSFGGVAATWQLTERLDLTTQLYAQSPYFDSELSILGDSSFQVAFGGIYRWPKHRLSLSFAIVEDVFADATTDVVLHLAVRTSSAKLDGGPP
jgi:hypothetical protein